MNPDLLVRDHLGAPGITALVAAFYRRVKTDPTLAPLYPEGDFEAAETRLRDFMLFRFDLSTQYVDQRGHPRLRMRHAPFAIREKEAEAWLALMNAAMDEQAISPDIREVLTAYFTHTAHFMRNHPG